MMAGLALILIDLLASVTCLLAWGLKSILKLLTSNAIPKNESNLPGVDRRCVNDGIEIDKGLGVVVDDRMQFLF
jgi:hypothetical protein